MKISFEIPESRKDLVLEMLKKSSGKVVTLSSDLVDSQGNFNYSWKGEEESEEDFVLRSIQSIIEGVVKWGLLVKDTNRFNLELESKRKEVVPIVVDIPPNLFLRVKNVR